MVAAIADGDTSQRRVMEWAIAQGPYMPSPTHQLVLLYLSANAFYTRDNPEGADIGQVLRARSSIPAIMAGTALRSRDSVRRVLSDLQDAMYLIRRERSGQGRRGRAPAEITLFWHERSDQYRADLRAGTATVPPAFYNHRPKTPEAPRPRLKVVQ